MIQRWLGVGRMLFLGIFAPLHVATNIVRRAQIEKAQSTLHQNPNQNFHHSSFIIIGLIITIISLKPNFSETKSLAWTFNVARFANALQVTLRLSVNNPCLCLCFLIILNNCQKAHISMHYAVLWRRWNHKSTHSLTHSLNHWQGHLLSFLDS